MGEVGRKIGGVESRMMRLSVSYLSTFLWSSVFVEERHTKAIFGTEDIYMREFIRVYFPWR